MNEAQRQEIIGILRENADEYYRNAIDTKKKKDYNTSATLFFKALSALCDLYIVINNNYFPTNHSDRFRILEFKYKELYEMMDKDFSIYQDSYRTKLNDEIC